MSSNKYRNPLLDSAMHVIKGAACIAFEIPTGRSTKHVKFMKDNKGEITLGPLNKEPSEDQKALLVNLVNRKVAEGAKFVSFSIKRNLAEELYGDIMYDDFGVPRSVTELRLVLLKEWNLNANNFPVLKTTKDIGSIEITEISYCCNKLQLQILFEILNDNVKREVIDCENNSILCQDELFTDDTYPVLLEVIPPSGVEKLDSIDSLSDQKVTPWEVVAESEEGLNYDKLLYQFGSSKITGFHIEKIERLTGKKAHRFLRRGIFFSHRDLDVILDEYERGGKFFLYTGRGPSAEALHLGHVVPFMFTKYLQDVFNVPLVIQLTDDEKFIFKDDLKLEETHRLAYENAKDIIAFGFDPEKTFIFADLDYIQYLYPTVLKIQKKVTYNQCRAIFGFTESDNIGKVAFPAVECAPCFAECFPFIFDKKIQSNTLCLVPQAIDQDPYFRMARDVAQRLGLPKPALIHSKFFPSLEGFKTKMSSSITSSTIYVTDTKEEIKNKIFKHAFSGGGSTVEEHRTKGGNLKIDVPFQYLTYMLEDDNLLAEIGKKYECGQMLTGEIKEELVKVVTEMVMDHQKRRAEVTDEMVRKFMDPCRPSLKACFETRSR